MVSLSEGRGKTIAWVFAALGFVVGFLIYDATASSSTLHRSDCQQLAPYVGDFFAKTEEFIAKDPEKWHRVERFYDGLFDELESYLPTTDVMTRLSGELRTALEDMARSIYGFNPNARNRERLDAATQQMQAKLDELAKVCR